ncbi:hypothetical protein BPOR_1776g00010 [Botrytis porri]|uniref:Uncharacterized protein n=1 Tax=Botrytis porri TaxID=87229 RepID=A0A4Z1K492_9HELO|nr:hypothetical protein BPOR_1776g00010 [Botrytis porri]
MRGFPNSDLPTTTPYEPSTALGRIITGLDRDSDFALCYYFGHSSTPENRTPKPSSRSINTAPIFLEVVGLDVKASLGRLFFQRSGSSLLALSMMPPK